MAPKVSGQLNSLRQTLFCRRVFSRFGGAMPMPHAHKFGTAWDITKDDYAYTCDLDLKGWAWEFLRRNKQYLRDFVTNRAGCPVPISHVSGANLYQLQRRFLEAETWGLTLFADPNKSALATDVFWLPDLLSNSVNCRCRPVNNDTPDHLSLASFRGQRAVLDGWNAEQILLQDARKSADILALSGSMLFGKNAVTFQHEGIESAFRHSRTLGILKGLCSENSRSHSVISQQHCKYLDYLIALDGFLEGRSYRDIAIALYGKDRIGKCWSNDTHGLKLKVRRAVKRGRNLMAGGYRMLL
jgi:hypothetical protein